MSEPRYALYFAPEDDSALARFGWEWLGRRPDGGELPPGQDDPAIVAEARRYGFHATLKPPFRLAAGSDRQALCAAAADFAAARCGFTEPPLAVGELDGFLALRPSRVSPAIAALAGDCVREFDRFRAPAGAEERSRRLAAPLTARQRQHVEAWGYPYVFEDFRFHLTLTCRLDEDERAACRALLHQRAATALAEPVAFRSLCLFEQATTAAPFILHRRFPFGA
jgi:putative phosphonate metabolism protein